MELTVKITPRVAAQVARRLRLAASVRSRSMSAMVNDALDKALPSLEEIRMPRKRLPPGSRRICAWALMAR